MSTCAGFFWLPDDRPALVTRLTAPGPLQLLAQGGPKMWEAFMEKLRWVHLGRGPPTRRWVAAQVQAACEIAGCGRLGICASGATNWLVQ
jgi:hypothetical protein